LPECYTAIHLLRIGLKADVCATYVNDGVHVTLWWSVAIYVLEM